MIIYKVTCLVNNKLYIGQTYLTLEERKWEHEHKHKSQRFMFQNALHKYGFDNFKWEILCECSSIDDMNEKEQYYIKHFNTHYIDGYGYNMTFGGFGSNGYKHTDEAKQKLSKSHMGIKREPMSDETKQKISKSLKRRIPWNTGKTLTDEHKRKISESEKGKIVSDETKLKMSETALRLYSSDGNEVLREKIAQKGSKNASYKYYWEVLDIETGSIEIVKAKTEWCRNNGLNYGSVKYYIKINKPYNGYLIKKVLDNKNEI